MTRYLISFEDGAMDLLEEELRAADVDSHAVVAQAREAGVWVTGGGIGSHEVSVVGTDGQVSEDQPRDGHLGGFSIVDVPSRAEAVAWAAKFALACRCAQEVREIMHDPAV